MICGFFTKILRYSSCVTPDTNYSNPIIYNYPYLELQSPISGLQIKYMLFATFQQQQQTGRMMNMNRIKFISIFLLFSILSSISLTNMAKPYPGEKVSVCHRGYLIEVNPNALQKHLDHGDYTPAIFDLLSAGNRYTCSVSGEPVVQTPL